MKETKNQKIVKINNVDYNIENLRKEINEGLKITETGEFIYKKTNYFTVSSPIEKAFIFNETKTVKFVKSEKEVTSEYNVDTLKEINDLLKSNQFNNPYIIEEEKKIYLSESNIMKILNKSIIYEIKNDDFIFKEINTNTKSKYGIRNKFKPLELSKYFYEFFKFNEQNENEYFEYYSENYDKGRLQLQEFLEQFEDEECNLNFFKLTGPSSNGKTTTLLKFARKNYNIMYFNLRFLQEKENDKQIINEYFCSELESLNLNEKIIKELNEYLKKNKYENFMKILNDIIYILKEYSIIIILDQYKKRNKLYYILNSFFEDVMEKHYKIKFILCSSINDEEIKEEVIKTIKFYKGMPTILNYQSQQFFFYFSILFQPRKNINDKYNPIYELFNYLPKYKSQFSKIDNKEKLIESVKKIDNQIIGKILENNRLINRNNLSGVFIIILNIINDEFKYCPNSYDLLQNYIPFKYFNIIFKENYFKIKYAFPYLESILFSKISIDEADSFFINNKFSFIPYLESYAKSYYFEFAAKYRFKSLINDYGEIKEIKVNKITEMTEIIFDPFQIALQKVFDNDKDNKDNKNKNDIVQIHQKEKVFSIRKDYLDNMINNTIKNIYYYKNLNNNKKVNLQKKYDFSEYNLLIDQNFIRGKNLDQSFIYGDKNNKTFIGIQIKCYTNKTTNLSSNLNFLDKDKIKKEIFSILENSKHLLNIDINEWKYLLVLYYNQNDSEGPFCKEIVNICNQKNIAYIFYDPYRKIFLDLNRDKLEKIDFSNSIFNLDSDKNIESMENCFGDINLNSKKILLNKKRKSDLGDYEELKNTFKLCIKKLKNTIYVNNNFQNDFKLFEDFKKTIINLIQIDSNKKEIILDNYFDGEDIEAPFPENNYIFLCNKKDTGALLLLVNYDNNSYVYDLQSKEKIDKIFEGLIIIDRKEKIIIMKIRDIEMPINN